MQANPLHVARNLESNAFTDVNGAVGKLVPATARSSASPAGSDSRSTTFDTPVAGLPGSKSARRHAVDGLPSTYQRKQAPGERTPQPRVAPSLGLTSTAT